MTPISKSRPGWIGKYRFSINKWHPDYLRRYQFQIGTLWDVGVHLGTPKLYYAFPDVKMMLVDPLWEVAAVCAEFGRRFDVTFLNVALGAQPGEATIYIPKAMGGSSLLTRTGLTRSGETLESRRVRVETLDCVNGTCRPPFGLKIDTEGYELEVLKGGTAFLRSTAFIILELSLKKRFEDSYRFSQAIEYLAGQGFELIDTLNMHAPDSPYADCLFVRKDDPRLTRNLGE